VERGLCGSVLGGRGLYDCYGGIVDVVAVGVPEALAHRRISSRPYSDLVLLRRGVVGGSQREL
jgi:hypothetical protein